MKIKLDPMAWIPERAHDTDAGLDFVGCEIDPDYFKAQEERFKEHTAQENLFLQMEMLEGTE